MKKTIQITESELKHLIKNSIAESVSEYKSIKRNDKNATSNSYIIVPEPGDYDYSNYDDCPFDVIKSENEPDELNNKTNENINMKKVIRINESDIDKMVTEALSELSYQTIQRAKEAGPYEADHDSGVWQFSDIADAVKTIRDALNFYTESGFHYDAIKGIENNPQYQAACKGVDAIEKFFTRKANQQLNFASRFDDYRREYDKEFEAKALEMFPELEDKSDSPWRGGVDSSKMTDEMYDQIVSQLSPKAKEFIENEGW